MVLGGEDVVLRSGVPEQLDPGARIELLGCEPRDEVVVVEVLAVDIAVVGVRRVVRVLHLVPVPLGVLLADRRPGGHRVDTPVDEDPELGVLEPVRRLVSGERGVGGLELRHTEGEPARRRGRVGAAAVRHDAAVARGARLDPGLAADTDPDPRLVAGGEARDAGGIDRTGALHIDGEGEGVGAEHGDRARVDDGGLDALGARVEQAGGGVGVTYGQRAALGRRLQRGRRRAVTPCWPRPDSSSAE